MVTWDRRRSGSKPPSLSAARCAGLWRDRKDAGISWIRRFRRCTGRLNATQPGVLAVSPCYIRGLGPARKGSVAMLQHFGLFRRRRVKRQLTLWFYAVRRLLGGTESLASRANHRVLLGRALVCAAALLCPDGATLAATPEGEVSTLAAAPNFPIVSEARLAGDARQTRFVLDLDKAIAFRA